MHSASGGKGGKGGDPYAWNDLAWKAEVNQQHNQWYGPHSLQQEGTWDPLTWAWIIPGLTWNVFHHYFFFCSVGLGLSLIPTNPAFSSSSGANYPAASASSSSGGCYPEVSGLSTPGGTAVGLPAEGLSAAGETAWERPTIDPSMAAQSSFLLGGLFTFETISTF